MGDELALHALVVSVWNALPDWVRQQKTTNGFKNAYDRWKTKHVDGNQSSRVAQENEQNI